MVLCFNTSWWLSLSKMKTKGTWGVRAILGNVTLLSVIRNPPDSYYKRRLRKLHCNYIRGWEYSSHCCCYLINVSCRASWRVKGGWIEFKELILGSWENLSQNRTKYVFMCSRLNPTEQIVLWGILHSDAFLLNYSLLIRFPFMWRYFCSPTLNVVSPFIISALENTFDFIC